MLLPTHLDSLSRKLFAWGLLICFCRTVLGDYIANKLWGPLGYLLKATQCASKQDFWAGLPKLMGCATVPSRLLKGNRDWTRPDFGLEHLI